MCAGRIPLSGLKMRIKWKIFMESMICFMHYEFAYTHTNRKCPNKLKINEIFTFGQTKNFFTKGIPFLELSRASDDEIS